jgi:hypothetical protein
VHVEVEHPQAAAHVAIVERGLQLGGGLGKGVGVLAGLDLAAALQQAHPAACAREPRCGDASAVARSHDHHVVVVTDLLDGTG